MARHQRQALATSIPILLVSVCFFVPGATRSQTAAGTAPSLDEITVIAPRSPTASEVAGDNIKMFINSHSEPKGSGTGTLSFWKEGVCVKTEGLSTALADYVSGRIEAIAAAVKTPPPMQDPCTPNVYVIFTDEPQRFIDHAVDQNPKILGYHYSAQLKKLKAVEHPIQAWHVTGLEAGASGVHLDSVWAPPLIVSSATAISTGVHSFILFTLIIVDVKKIEGYNVRSISDYVAMVTLAQVRLTNGCGELPSILDLMASACTREKPQSITAADLSYLRALNTVGQEVDYFMQTKAIEFKMKKQLAN